MTKKQEYFPNLGGYPEWKPNQFVQKIKQAYYNRGFTDGFIESSGRKGVGKTSLCLIIGKQVYGTYEQALDHLYFTPKLALESLRALMKDSKKTGNPVKRVPYIIIDDATMSLNKSRWWLPGIQDFAEFYGIIRSCCASVIFSGPSLRLPESISCDIEFKIIVKHIASEKRIKEVAEGNFEKTSFWKRQAEQATAYGIKKKYLWRQARIYSNFTIPSSPKRFISPNIMTTIFPLHYPDNIFKEYEKRRNEKVFEMLDRAIEGEKPKKIGRPPNSNLLHTVVRNAYYDHKKKGYSQKKSSEIMGISKDMLQKHVTEANNLDKNLK